MTKKITSIITLALFLLIPLLSHADIQRASLTSTSAQGNDDMAEDEALAISNDGRYTLFSSNATNLVAGDTNAATDLFIFDKNTGSIERMLDGAGIEGNGDTKNGFDISSDNRYVAFTSSASNLVAGDTNAVSDIFVYDRTNDTIERVSVSSAGVEGNGASVQPSISDDGRYVSFSSDSTNLVAGDANDANDIFVYDRTNDTIERVSVSSAGVEGNGASGAAALSGDGRYVVFGSNAQNLVAGDTGRTDVFVHDLANSTTEKISLNALGATANGNSGESFSGISYDGRYIAFQSYATDLIAGGTTAASNIFVYDQVDDTLELVSSNSADVEGNNSSLAPYISNDGAYVTFSSLGTNLVAGDTNATYDTFRKNLATRETVRTSVSDDAVEGSGLSYVAAISGDGCYVAFISFATNLVAGDTNGFSDIFVQALCVEPPTVVAQSTDSANTITGTWDETDATGLSIVLDGETYTLGSDAVLSSDGTGNWSLDVRSLSFSPGTYEVVATNSNIFASEDDDTTNELVITSGGGGGGGGGGVIFGCKDEKASNYRNFVSHKPSLCEYKFPLEEDLDLETEMSSQDDDKQKFTLPEGETCPYFVGYYRKGATGYEVAKVQDFLNKYMKTSLIVDGNFGLQTEQAVKDFQLRHREDILDPWGLGIATGWQYKTTQGVMNEIVGCETEDRFLERVNRQHSFDNPSLFDKFKGVLLPSF